MATRHDHSSLRGLKCAGFIVGIALSGFFDGILLHQVLQWHHLLSLVPGKTYQDLRTQVYADGLFHVAVYGVTLIGLAVLWRHRAQLSQRGASRQFAGGAILGFGVWNIVDVGLFHWILGIHRIRVNVPNLMAYDLAWFIGLGVVVAVVGLWILGRGKGTGTGTGGTSHGGAVAGSFVAALVIAVPVANIPSPDGNSLIIFRPDLGPAKAINAILDANGSIVMIDPEGSFAVARLAAGGSTSPLYGSGALLVSRSPALAGCLAFTKLAT